MTANASGSGSYAAPTVDSVGMTIGDSGPAVVIASDSESGLAVINLVGASATTSGGETANWVFVWQEGT